MLIGIFGLARWVLALISGIFILYLLLVILHIVFTVDVFDALSRSPYPFFRG